MATELNYVIGPYIEIIGKHTKSISKVRRVCPEHSKFEATGNFCRICGAALENLSTIQERPISLQQFIWEKFEDDDSLFACDDINVILPNHRPPGKISLDRLTDLTNCQEIITKQLDWFRQKYENHIKVIEETFGSDKAILKWGITSYSC